MGAFVGLREATVNGIVGMAIRVMLGDASLRLVRERVLYNTTSNAKLRLVRMRQCALWPVELEEWQLCSCCRPRAS